MPRILSGPSRPFVMPPQRGKRRADSWRNARRPTVADRERSDAMVSDFACGVMVLALLFAGPNLAALLYQAAAL